MKDGRRIFEGDEVMMYQFSYQAQLRKWGDMGDTGFRFSLREADTLVPVTTASLSFLRLGLDFSIEEEETCVILVYLPDLKKAESYQFILKTSLQLATTTFSSPKLTEAYRTATQRHFQLPCFYCKVSDVIFNKQKKCLCQPRSHQPKNPPCIASSFSYP